MVATGTFGRTPHIPDVAAELNPAILQLHSSEYRRPGQISDGPCSSSARAIPAPTSPTSWPSRTRRSWPAVTAARSRRGSSPAASTPCCRYAVRLAPRPHPEDPDRPQGQGRAAHPRRPDAAREAAGPPRPRRRTRHQPHRGGARRQARRRRHSPRRRPRSCGRPASVRSSTGSACRSWATTAGRRELRGVSPDVPGLFFCGLCFQYSFSSMVLPGVGRDAAYVAERIASRHANRRTLDSGSAADTRAWRLDRRVRRVVQVGSTASAPPSSISSPRRPGSPATTTS